VDDGGEHGRVLLQWWGRARIAGMAKKSRKKKARKNSKANHGKRPNS
jgi:hypothetical protein